MNSVDRVETRSFSATAHSVSGTSGSIKSWLKAAIPQQRLIFPIVDSIILIIAVISIFVLCESSFSSLSFYVKPIYPIISVVITLFCFYIFGLYDHAEYIKPFDAAYRLTKVIFVASVMNVFVCLAFGLQNFLGYSTLLFSVLGWCIFLRHLIGLLILRKPVCKRVLIVANSDESVNIARSLAQNEGSLYDLAGCVVGDKSRLDDAGELLTYGDEKDFLGAAEMSGASIIAMTDEEMSNTPQEIYRCLEHGLEVAHLYGICEKALGKLPLSRATFLLGDQKVNRPIFFIAKRTLDLITAVVGNIFLLLILLPVAIAIKTTSPGPIFYSQIRCGKNGHLFMLYKFRTMVVDAERNGPQWANTNDFRITSVGRFLRRTHIDEVPQFINLLRGDISLVGPRPERPEIIDTFKKKIPFFEYRHLVQPGITGWAQVNAPYASSIEAAREKIQYDFFYIKNRCFFLDLIILLKTVKSVIQMRGQ